MARRPSPTLENAVASGVRVARIEPIQRRIERNSWKFVGFMVAFTSSISIAAALVACLFASLLSLMLIYSKFGAPFWHDLSQPATFIWRTTLGTFAASLAVSWVLAIWKLTRAEHVIARRLGARVPRPEEYRSTRRVLHDVALAAGMKIAPMLYVIETDRVNAFVLGHSRKNARVGVTTGLLERISLDEQRAVFANLVARVLSLDTLWATALAAVMGPVWAFRDHDLARESESGSLDAPKRGRQEFAYVTATAFPFWLVIIGAVVVVTEVLSWYHREATWQAAEKADAEGMLLLKDPKAMLSALEHVLERDNHVPRAGDAYSPLFYCWAGFGFAPEDDPEMLRVARLRETLGAEGVPYLPRPNVPRWSSPPLPPRIELLQELDTQQAGAAPPKVS